MLIGLKITKKITLPNAQFAENFLFRIKNLEYISAEMENEEKIEEFTMNLFYSKNVNEDIENIVNEEVEYEKLYNENLNFLFANNYFKTADNYCNTDNENDDNDDNEFSLCDTIISANEEDTCEFNSDVELIEISP